MISSRTESSDRALPAGLQTEQASSWRSSLYAEPTWVSVAWIVIPMALAGIAIFFAMR